MNSAVEPLLKAINDLSARVNTLEAEKRDLIRRIDELESNVRDLQDSALSNNYHWNTTINTGTYTPYWRSITERETIMWTQSYISDLASNNDW